MTGIDKDLVELKMSWLDGNRNQIDSIVLDRLKEQAPCFVVHMESGVILFASRRVNDIFGYLFNELENKNIEELIPVRLRESHKKHLQGFNKNPHYRQMGGHGQALVGVKKDGNEFNIKISLEPFYQNSVGYVFATVMAI